MLPDFGMAIARSPLRSLVVVEGADAVTLHDYEECRTLSFAFSLDQRYIATVETQQPAKEILRVLGPHGPPYSIAIRNFAVGEAIEGASGERYRPLIGVIEALSSIEAALKCP